MYFTNDKYFSHITIFVVLSPFRNEVRGEVVCVCGVGGGWGGVLFVLHTYGPWCACYYLTEV